MRKFVSFFLALAIAAGLCAPALAAEEGLANFQKVHSYTEGQFTDVAAESWCAESVRAAFEYGLMDGVGGGRFAPDGSLTLAQTVVMACRIHSTYLGEAPDFSGGEPWYQPYLDYALDSGLITRDYSDGELGQAVTRADFAVIVGAALPDEALPEISSIEEGAIPDVTAEDPCYEAVYRLYRAGVLTGNDASGTFAPDSGINRGSAAALVSRMVDPSLRRQISLVRQPFTPVSMDQLANLDSLRKNATDEELAQAYDVALEIVTPLADLSREEQLLGIAIALRSMFDSGMLYSSSGEHYNDPYGYFVLGMASCAGCTRATGLCLNILGIPYEHVNENQWSHQWCRVDVDGTYWICDAYGLYCGPEPAPYTHPYLA